MENKQYVVSYINFFDNDLKMVRVEATDTMGAIRTAYGTWYPDDSGDFLEETLKGDLEETKCRFWDCDSAIDVLEL